MTLTRATSGWGLIGAAVGIVATVLVQTFASRYGIGFSFLGAVIAVLSVSLCSGGGAAIGWSMARAGSRGRGCLAPAFAIALAIAILGVVLPMLAADLLAQATGAAISQAQGRVGDVLRGRTPTGADAVVSATAVARHVAAVLVGPVVALTSLIIAPVAALFSTGTGGVRSE